MRFGKALLARLRMAGRISAINLRGQLDFRADFVAGILKGVLWQTSIVVFAAVLLTRFPRIGSWSSRSVLLLASMRLTSHGLSALFFGRVEYIHTILQEGRIDIYLTRPLSVYRQLQYSIFSANAFGDLLVGGTMLGVAITAFDRPWTTARLVMLVAGIGGGCLLETAVNNVLAGLVILQPLAASWLFWFQDLLAAVGNYPLNILPSVAQLALTFVLPIAFIAYLPAAAITGNLAVTGVPAWLAYSAPVIGLGFYGLSRLAWSICLSRYRGANG